MSGTASPAGSKQNVYAEAADPTRYRVADAPLFTCAEHGEACVLCVTAGKNGRNGRTAAVGATLFWLTCPHLNAIIARLEGHRGVPTVTAAMARHAPLRAWHVQSHDVYARRAEELLSDEQWGFFEAHFLSSSEPLLHKYGNAAVSHAEDMKCLHALVAQTLAGAANPIGSVVLNYVLFLHQLIHAWVREPEAAEDATRQAMRTALDSAALFETFMDATVRAVASRGLADWRELGGAELQVLHPEGTLGDAAATLYVWCADAQLSSCSPDLCACSLAVLTTLEGKPPRRHKKHRIN